MTTHWKTITYAFYDEMLERIYRFETRREMKAHHLYPGLGLHLETNQFRVLAVSAVGFPEGSNGIHFRLESGRMENVTEDILIRMGHMLLVDYEVQQCEMDSDYQPYFHQHIIERAA